MGPNKGQGVEGGAFGQCVTCAAICEGMASWFPWATIAWPLASLSYTWLLVVVVLGVLALKQLLGHIV